MDAAPHGLAESGLPHRVALDGPLNFRDLGGWRTSEGRRVARGWLFRSDSLATLTPADERRVFDDLGVGLAVDLRSPSEREEARFAASKRIETLELPLLPELGDADPTLAESDLASRYLRILERSGDRLVGVLEALARSERPAVFFCAAGKDRTGLVACMALACVGVRDEDLIADYAASHAAIDRILERLAELEGYREMFEVLPPWTLHARAETLAGFLALVRERFGSPAEWARAAGLSDGARRRLATRMLPG